ncbi:MAG: acylphosphatase [Bacillota bacterium]
MPKIRMRVIITGRVQGVYFRGHTREKALEEGVAGWIRNLADGSVEAVLEGEENAVEAVVDWCRKGPPSARVKRVEDIRESWSGEFKGFNIRW